MCLTIEGFSSSPGHRDSPFAGGPNTEGDSVASHRSGSAEVPNISRSQSIPPRHSVAYHIRHRIRSVIASVVVAAITLVGTVAGITWLDLAFTASGRAIPNIASGASTEEPLVDPNAGKEIQFLVLGQDTRDGEGNEAIGGDLPDEHNADTTMIVQISADRSYINLVSIPRDSIVDAPSCKTTKGTVPARYQVMFNSIFATGWRAGGDLSSAASCTLTAVNKLTGLNISNFIVADFEGLKNMIDAIGGVNICIPVHTKDATTGLDLAKGLHKLNGTQATQYARMRHGTGTDGSDIMRTTRQQYLVKELLSESLQKNLFTQTDQLYQLAKATLNSLSMSPGLANIGVLAGLAMSLKSMDSSHLYARTTPVTAAPNDADRVVWTESADDLWAVLREGKALTDQPEQQTTSSPSTSTKTSQAPSQSSSSSSTSQAPTVNPTTGLITKANGTLVDPNTGGTVDPENGVIRDANTGQYIGIADRYLNATVCKVTAQN